MLSEGERSETLEFALFLGLSFLFVFKKTIFVRLKCGFLVLLDFTKLWIIPWEKWTLFSKTFASTVIGKKWASDNCREKLSSVERPSGTDTEDISWKLKDNFRQFSIKTYVMGTH